MNFKSDCLRFPGLLLCAALGLAGCGGGDASTTPPANAVPAAPTPTPTPTPITPAPVIPVVPVAPVVPVITGQGELRSATALASVSVVDVIQAVNAPGAKAPPITPRYGVMSYRLNYFTVDGAGKQVLASGLVAVPIKGAGATSPVLSYQHGTIFRDAQAPSNAVLPTEPPIVMASLGYIVVAADYVGYGVSKGAQHPYLLSAPAAAVVMDLLTAAKTWRRVNNMADNGQLFLAGYSEGGYVTMAAHRAMQAAAGTHTPLMAVPGAGPYHVGVTLDELLKRVRSESPILGALISPGLLRNLGSSVRNEVRRQLFKQLVPEDSDVSFQSTFIDNYLADDDAAIERVSNVHDWKPDVPVRMFHGRDDQTVPYPVATRTLQAMLARGASTATLSDCTATPSSHQGCVLPYWSFMLGNFSGLARDL